MTWDDRQGRINRLNWQSYEKQITYTPISSNNNTNLLGDVIKLGIDVHKHKYVVVQKVDGSLPERPRSFTHLSSFLSGWISSESVVSVVRVPSKEEEQLRSITRQRQSLIKERSRNTNRGRSYALYYGVALKGIWWLRETWKS